MRAGEVLVIPPNLLHRVEALEESLATDLFTPGREDWLRRRRCVPAEVQPAARFPTAEARYRRRNSSSHPADRGPFLRSCLQNRIHSGDNRHGPHPRHVVRRRPDHYNRLTRFEIGQRDGWLLFNHLAEIETSVRRRGLPCPARRPLPEPPQEPLRVHPGRWD